MKKESIKFDGFIVTELKDNKKIVIFLNRNLGKELRKGYEGIQN